MSEFDPYYDWLGIPPADSAKGGPHHYRLLGLQAFESNPRVIENAADRLMTQLRGFAAGPNGKLSQKLLNEVAAARACLLDEKKKAAYDKPLRAKLAAAAPKPQIAVQPVYVPVPVPVPVPTALPPMPTTAPAPPPPAEANGPPAWPAASSAPFAISTSRYRGKSGGGSGLGLAVVGLGGLAIAVVGAAIFIRTDPLELFKPPAATTAVHPTPAVITPKPTTKPASEPTTTATTTPDQPTSTPATTENPATPATDPATTSSTTTNPPGAETPDPRPLPGTGDPPIAPMPLAGESPVSPAADKPAAEKRRPPPSSDEQQAKLAELKELYKAEFDSGLKPAGREAFAEFLLATTDRLKSDAVARFVLLREAYSRFVQLKDFAPAAEVIDRLDSEFAMEEFKLRLHWLTEASPAAKLPAERLAIVLLASELAEQAVVRQKIDDADKMVRIAEGQAKNLNDSKLRVKMTAQRIEVEKLAAAWSPVQKAREALAANPSDAAAALIVGKHACLMEGNWKTGLELLAKSSDAALAAAAVQDLAGPAENITAAALGDRWYDIARDDKTLENFYARARYWYQRQPTAGEDLDQARLQQRIEQIEALNLPPRLLEENVIASASEPLPSFAHAYAKAQWFEPVDLLQLVQRQDLAASPWGATRELPLALYSDDDTPLGRLPVRYAPPREYQLTLRVRRGPAITRFGFPPREIRAAGPFVVGLVGPKGPLLACIDVPAGGEFATYLSVADAQMPADNPTYRRQAFAQIPSSTRDEATIVCQVRRKSVTITIGGNEVCRYEGDLARLGLPKEWSVGDPKALVIGSHQCGYCVTGWTLEPLPMDAPPTFQPAALPFGQQ
jgi:hypothetical protein